jgi:hypothetical protein
MQAARTLHFFRGITDAPLIARLPLAVATVPSGTTESLKG